MDNSSHVLFRLFMNFSKPFPLDNPPVLMYNVHTTRASFLDARHEKSGVLTLSRGMTMAQSVG